MGNHAVRIARIFYRSRRARVFTETTRDIYIYTHTSDGDVTTLIAALIARGLSTARQYYPSGQSVRRLLLRSIIYFSFVPCLYACARAILKMPLEVNSSRINGPHRTCSPRFRPAGVRRLGSRLGPHSSPIAAVRVHGTRLLVANVACRIVERARVYTTGRARASRDGTTANVLHNHGR